VIYADTADRERAFSFCDRLMQQFWAEVDFEFCWWRFRYLEDPELADAAAQAASAADMVIVSARASDDLPAHVKDWFNLWLSGGSARDAALVLLPDPGHEPDLGVSPFVSFAEQTARHAHLDCLLPLRATRRFAESGPLGAMRDRATHVSRVLDEILHHVGPPPTLPTHWGLNE
jgi:hypothetical protein